MGENKCSVLVAACDTFRAGAVEQLRTHVKRLNSLYPAHQQADNKAVVELYEKGYGKDAAGIAMEAINYARSARLDVVLVDTAGRMQDNEPLMRSLSRLISVSSLAKPWSETKRLTNWLSSMQHWLITRNN